jgi:SAM-dependent methyltransferase
MERGVPDFFNHYRGPRRKPRWSWRLKRNADRLIALLSLPPTAAVRTAVVDIIGRTGRSTDDKALTAEIKDLYDRFGLNGEGVRIKLPRVPFRANARPEVRFERHYFPGRLPPDTKLTRNVRVRNAGRHAWSSRARHPFLLSYRWLDASGAVAISEGPRSSLPVDVEPGRAMSIPLSVVTPPAEGRFTLRVIPFVEGVSRLETHALDIDIEITRHAEATTAMFERGSTVGTYAEDHAAGRELLLSFLRERAAGPITLLEVGGATHPQAAWIPGCSLVNLDISSPLLELGALYFGPEREDQVCFVCGNAMDPPFQPGTFDGAVLFSTLHHFPEPERLLSTIKTLVKPGGFITVMCEPVGSEANDPQMVRDLLKGINEQVFTLEEYVWMFEAAGLRVERARVDVHSLKAILSV